MECCTGRLLYECILNQLRTTSSDLENTTNVRCDNMNDFIRMLRSLLMEGSLGGETVYIVIDKCERLRDMEVNILPAFSRLSELTSCNLCVIFLSEIIFEKFRQGTGVREPFLLHFPDYSKTELLEIMTLAASLEHPREFYHGFCQLLLSVFYNICRDLKELMHLVSLKKSLLMIASYKLFVRNGMLYQMLMSQLYQTERYKTNRDIGLELERDRFRVRNGFQVNQGSISS